MVTLTLPLPPETTGSAEADVQSDITVDYVPENFLVPCLQQTRTQQTQTWAPLFRPDSEQHTSDEEYIKDVLKMMGKS